MMLTERLAIAAHLRVGQDIKRRRRYLALVSFMERVEAALQTDQDARGYDGWLDPCDRYQGEGK